MAPLRSAIILLLTLTPLLLNAQSRAGNDPKRVAADACVTSFMQWQPERLAALLHPGLLQLRPIDMWKSFRQQVLNMGGKYLGHRYHRSSRKHDVTTLVYRVTFARDSLEFLVSIDSLNLVESFSAEVIEQTFSYPAPPYASQSRFTEKKLTLAVDSARLPARIAVPKGKGRFPAVVLVHDAGPHDMDMTTGGLKPLRDIAWGLASRGVVTLRYEKRTRVLGRAFDMRGATVKQEITDDVRAAVRLLATRRDVDPSKILVAGYGLGGMTLPDLARADSAVRGIALLSVPGRPLEDVLDAQLHERLAQMDSSAQDERTRIEQSVAALARVRKGGASATDIVMGVPASYFYDLRGRDQVVSASVLDIPMLLVTAGRDTQVGAVDRDIWARTLGAKKNVRLHFCENCSHLLNDTAEAAAMGHVTEEVLTLLAAWAQGR